jgi:hypothetical protein
MLDNGSQVTLYDSAGNEVAAPPVGSYLLPISIRQTAASEAGVTVWSMRNGATYTCNVKSIHLVMGFDGTASLGAVELSYCIQRFSTATPSGGTALTAIKKRSADGASSIADARYLDTGLTVTSVVFETDAIVLGLPGTATGICVPFNIPLEIPGQKYGTFDLAVNEGLCIRLKTAAIVGQELSGFIQWDER